MRTNATWNPAELLVASLTRDNLERRIVEALPWLVLEYYDMDWPWVIQASKLRGAQNRLGFAVTLAREIAEQKPDSAIADHLQTVETRLQSSLLPRIGTFCHEAMSKSERTWLRRSRTSQAQKWNLLSDLAPEHLTHAK